MAQMRIFVSHSHEDDTFCRALVEGLRQAGADVWYDEHNLGSGQLLDTIEVELRERPVFVLVLSPAALASPWVRDETKWAFTRLRRDPSRILLPVLAAIVEEDTIWLFLQDFKRVEAPGIQPYPQAEAVTRTLHALQLTLPGEVPQPTAPQPTESAEDLITRGRALAAQKKYFEALPLFQRATQLDPHSFDAWVLLGGVCSLTDRVEQGLAAVDRAIILNPDNATAWMVKGEVLGELKRYDEALAAYDWALALDPSDAGAWYTKGYTLGGMGRYQEALVAYDRALALDPTDRGVWTNKANTLEDLTRYEPNNADAWYRRGCVLGELNRYEEALACYNRALAITPNDARIWHNKGTVLFNLKRYTEATAVYDKALVLDPNLALE
jgi:Flp pilus assembly protein TadD